MATRSRKPLVQKVLILGVVLAAIQGLVIVLMPNSGDNLAPREAISKAVEKVSNVTPERREMMRLQLAIADYMSKSGGRPPASLSALVPTYFDQLPQNPSTNKPFPYRVEGVRYFLGDESVKSPSTSSSGSAGGLSAAAQKAAKKATEGKTGAAAMAEEDKKELLASLSQEAKPAKAYDPSGMRDPFRPFDLSPDALSQKARTPLEAVPTDRLSYTAFVQGAEPRAIVEASDGKGYTIKKGDKIGTRNGEVTDILPEKIIIVETETDFTGETKSRKVELSLGVKAFDPSSMLKAPSKRGAR